MNLFTQVVASIVRFALAGLVGYLVSRGIFSAELGADLLLTVPAGLAVLAWSFWEKQRQHNAFLAALELPKGSTIEDVKAALKRAQGGRESV